MTFGIVVERVEAADRRPTWDEMESMAFDVSVEKAPIIAPGADQPLPEPGAGALAEA